MNGNHGDFMYIGPSRVSESVPDYTEEDDGDVELQNLKNAFRKRTTVSNDNNNNNNAPKRPVITFPSINQQFKTDVAKAVANNIPLHHDPETILRNNGAQIENIQQRIIEEERRKDIMHKNPVFRFAKAVQSLVGPQMQSKIANFGLDESNSAIQIVLGDNVKSAVTLHDDATMVAEGNKKPSSVVPKDGDFRFEENSANSGRMRIVQGKYLEDVMRSANVTGKSILSDHTVTRVNQALGLLRSVDYQMFNGKTLEHMIRDEQVMSQFAELVAMCFTEGMIKHSSRYMSDATLPREKREMNQKALDIKIMSIFDSSINGFRSATSSERQSNEFEYIKAVRRMTSHK